MPPSPALRISPRKELRAENHKRGHSLESGILYQKQEDDLALFNDVQKRERENFLLQSNDNFDDIFSTNLRYFSDSKLGISIPARGGSSDLLKAEGDKNDYDWLITPPETPLFSSLDDEAPPVSLASRGRPRSQPVLISRSPSMEKGYRSSASPHRLSPSPRSDRTLQSRIKPFSATHSSPPPTLRHPSPSGRLSPPSTKPTPAPRSRTPTPRRMSTSSAGSIAQSKLRGTSPIKASPGNSASPKIRAWQSNIPGFSSEAPPNLRTSLADRPASYVRGSSPASRNGSRYGRQSMSPTASRSVSSSHSNDRDPFSSHGKGSVASSGDDDVDSLQSIPVSSSDRSASRSIGAYPSNKAISFSKKPTKILSSSAPKRSFDLVRQMDWKAPQTMFRPLLSSVPSTTFYVGNSNECHCSPSRNSPTITSSDCRSDQATSGAHDIQRREQNKDAASDFVRGYHPDGHDEVFVMDQADALNQDVENRILEGSLGSQHGKINAPSVVSSPLDIAESSNRLDTSTTMETAVMVLDGKHDYSHAGGTPDALICSKCGCMFHPAEVVTGDQHLCLECDSLEVNSTIPNSLERVMVGENSTTNFVQILERGSLTVLDRSASITESLQVTWISETGTSHIETTADSDSSQSLSTVPIEEGELTFATQQVTKQLMDCDTGYQQLHHAAVNSNSQADGSEGVGMSLLLKRSSKGHIVQSRSFTASNTSYDDCSYVRDSVNSMRSSIERSSASVSSSVDQGSSRQAEIRIHRQSSGQKSDLENYRYEMPTKHKRSASSLSGASSHMFQVLSVTQSCLDDSFEVVSTHMDKEFGEETCAYPHAQSLASECTEAESTGTDIESNIIFKTASELSNYLMHVHSGDTSVMSGSTSEEPASQENGENLAIDSVNSMNIETSSAHSETFIQEEDARPGSYADRADVAEVPHPSSLDAISELEIENVDVVSADSLSDTDSTIAKSYTNELRQHDVTKATVEESDFSHPRHEESRILLEDIGGTKARSLSLDEATDTILFCSSIVYNLAYEAANIAIDNEMLPMEAQRPTVTFVAKSSPKRRDTSLRTVGKRNSKSRKAQQKRLEMDTKPPSSTPEINGKSGLRIVEAPNSVDTMKPPKLESKCNCIIM